MQPAETGRRLLSGARACAVALEAHPRRVLAVLVLANVVSTAAFAATVPHNGWAWYQGGDQLWYVTSGWLLGTGHLPPTIVGYGWSLAVMPVTWITGPTWLQAIPVVVVVNVLVLVPLALLALYALASAIAGRLFGYWAALLWIILPFAAIPLFDDRYHERFVDQFLPQALGLTGMADFPSTVAVLAAAALVARSLRRPGWDEALLAGLVAGFAGGLKPPNYLFAIGAVLAYAVARRPREAATFLAALVPTVVALTIWKARGLGSIPVFALEESRQAVSAGASFTGLSIERYVDIDLGHWREQMDQLREYFWSLRLAQWTPVAGLIAVLRVRPALAALLGGWLASYLLVKGTTELATIESGSFFRFVMPGWPAYVLLAAAIPFLVPGLYRRAASHAEPPPARETVRRRWVAVAAVPLAFLPIVWVAAARPIHDESRAVLQDTGSTQMLTPVDPSIVVRVTPDGEARVITWDDPHRRAKVFYRVFRTLGAEPDVLCDTKGAADCVLEMIVLGTTRERRLVDGSPPPGVTYRVGVATNYRDDPAQGDVFAVSPPVRDLP